jgi:hypothetical protein
MMSKIRERMKSALVCLAHLPPARRWDSSPLLSRIPTLRFAPRHWQYESCPFDFYVGVDFGRMMLGLLVKSDDGFAIALGIGPLYIGIQR